MNSERKLDFVVTTTKKLKSGKHFSPDLKHISLNRLPDHVISLCRLKKWPKLISLCLKQPKICSDVDPFGNTFLHHICQNDPPVECVHNFLKYCSKALMKQDLNGNIPIHMAMTNGASHELLWLLIQEAPESVNVENKWGYKAWDWVYERCLYELVTVDKIITKSSKSFQVHMKWKRNIWRTLDVLVRAMVNEDNHSSRSLLHMILDFDCPPRLAQAIADEYPGMTIERDGKGRVPIAYAAESKNTPIVQLVIQILVLANPNALMEKDGLGRIAVHKAIESDKSWNMILQEMVRAAPDSIRLKDPVTNLYPAMLLSTRHLSNVGDVYEALSFSVDICRNE